MHESCIASLLRNPLDAFELILQALSEPGFQGQSVRVERMEQSGDIYTKYSRFTEPRIRYLVLVLFFSSLFQFIVPLIEVLPCFMLSLPVTNPCVFSSTPISQVAPIRPSYGYRAASAAPAMP